MVVVLVVSRNTQVTDKERNYRLALLKTPIEEMDGQETRRTLKYALVLAPFGVVMTTIMLKYYVLPYQRALAPGDELFRFDWFSGEALAAWGWMILYGGLGWLMYRVVSRSYLARN